MRNNMKNSTCLVLFAIVAIFAFASPVKAGFIDINGGSSWSGWSLRGKSNDLGVYGRGSTSNVFEIYTTVFSFNNNTVSGSPAGNSGFSSTSGAFQNGNRILGVGIRHISGSISSSEGLGIVRFDLGKDSYKAAASVGGSDGRTSSTAYADAGDFNTQFNGPGRAASALPVFYGPRATGSFFVSSYTDPFRGFSRNIGASGATLQMFFDLTELSNAVVNTHQIGTIGDDFALSIRGFGNTDVVVAVPEPGTSALLFLGLTSFVARFRRREESEVNRLS
jgi:hypothetical protein